MAVLSPSNDALVIRVVYDGPPMAGKTTSVRALAGKLGGEVKVPAEIDGRTLYFDWLDYTGGLFEGRRIRCQIISVPGQATLASRRRRLLETADVVVFVSDSTAEGVEQMSNYLGGLRRVLATLPGPPVGVVVQANKRDRPDAVSIAELSARLEQSSNPALIESIATEGVGVREAFVFAVRLALDRVRELMRNQQLKTVEPAIDSCEALLEDLKSAEGDALASVANSGLTHTRMTEIRLPSIAEQSLSEVIQAETQTPVVVPSNSVPNNNAPLPPQDNLPGGMIWPPVEGRIILHEIANSQFELRHDANGDWRASVATKWLVHSPASARFDDLQLGRTAILNWARIHSGCQRIFSGRRCIVLAPDGRGEFRLWQIIERSPALVTQIEYATRVGVGSMIASLIEAARLLQRADRDWINDANGLPVTLDTVGESSGMPRFVGLMPFPGHARQRESIDWSNAIADDLQAMLGDIRRLRDEFSLEHPSQGFIPTNLRTDPAGAVVERFLQAV